MIEYVYMCNLFYIFHIILQEKATTVSASVKKVTNDNAQLGKDMDILAESLTQQPNLSQEWVYI